MKINKCEFCGRDTKNPKFCNYNCHSKHIHKSSINKNPIDIQLALVAEVTQGQLPHGVIGRIAENLGVTHQRVTQRAKSLGYLSIARINKENPTRFCEICKTLISLKRKRCDKHKGKYFMDAEWLKSKMGNNTFKIEDLQKVFNLRYFTASNLKTSFKKNNIIKRANKTNPAIYKII